MTTGVAAAGAPAGKDILGHPRGLAYLVFAIFGASLVAIFAPVIFVSGILGQFLRSFAIVVTFGVLVSLFVSLTLTPMLCSRYLQVEKKHGRLYWYLEHAFGRLDSFYRRSLGWAIRHRWVARSNSHSGSTRTTPTRFT